MEKGYAALARVAHQMIAAYGASAPLVATERLNECMDKGDQHGCDNWVQVVYQIHRLQQGMRPLGW